MIARFAAAFALCAYPLVAQIPQVITELEQWLRADC